MSGTESTPFSDKCNVLAELWMDYREEEGFKEIMSYGDLGFPLAFAISELKVLEI